MLGNLKSMAQDMGNELDTQNKQIGRIEQKVIFPFQFLKFRLVRLVQ